jgi:hypothetical protein
VTPSTSTCPGAQPDLLAQLAVHGLQERLAGAHPPLGKLPGILADPATDQQRCHGIAEDDADVGAEAVLVDEVHVGAPEVRGDFSTTGTGPPRRSDSNGFGYTPRPAAQVSLVHHAVARPVRDTATTAGRPGFAGHGRARGQRAGRPADAGDAARGTADPTELRVLADLRLARALAAFGTGAGWPSPAP